MSRVILRDVRCSDCGAVTGSPAGAVLRVGPRHYFRGETVDSDWLRQGEPCGQCETGHVLYATEPVGEQQQ